MASVLTEHDNRRGGRAGGGRKVSPPRTPQCAVAPLWKTLKCYASRVEAAGRAVVGQKGARWRGSWPCTRGHWQLTGRPLGAFAGASDDPTAKRRAEVAPAQQQQRGDSDTRGEHVSGQCGRDGNERRGGQAVGSLMSCGACPSPPEASLKGSVAASWKDYPQCCCRAYAKKLPGNGSRRP